MLSMNNVDRYEPDLLAGQEQRGTKPCHGALATELPRMQALKEMDILHRDMSFLSRNIGRISTEFQMPICAVTVIGRHFQHTKVSVGTDLVLMHRDHAFCSHTILKDEVLVVRDARKDVRFRTNPYVVDGPCIRFYAGAPLLTRGGQRLGALCLIDFKPRAFTNDASRRLLRAAHDIAGRLGLNQPKEVPWKLFDTD